MSGFNLWVRERVCRFFCRAKKTQRNHNAGTLEPWNLLLGCKSGLIKIIIITITATRWRLRLGRSSCYISTSPTLWNPSSSGTPRTAAAFAVASAGHQPRMGWLWNGRGMAVVHQTWASDKMVGTRCLVFTHYGRYGRWIAAKAVSLELCPNCGNGELVAVVINEKEFSWRSTGNPRLLGRCWSNFGIVCKKIRWWALGLQPNLRPAWVDGVLARSSCQLSRHIFLWGEKNGVCWQSGPFSHELQKLHRITTWDSWRADSASRDPAFCCHAGVILLTPGSHVESPLNGMNIQAASSSQVVVFSSWFWGAGAAPFDSSAVNGAAALATWRFRRFADFFCFFFQIPPR